MSKKVIEIYESVTRKDMIDFIIAFGGVDNQELRDELSKKDDNALISIYQFSKFAAKMFS